MVMEDEQLHSAGSISFRKGAGERFQAAKLFYERHALTSCLYMRKRIVLAALQACSQDKLKGPMARAIGGQVMVGPPSQ